MEAAYSCGRSVKISHTTQHQSQKSGIFLEPIIGSSDLNILYRQFSAVLFTFVVTVEDRKICGMLSVVCQWLDDLNGNGLTQENWKMI
jgi:hypothetical protein